MEQEADKNLASAHAVANAFIELASEDDCRLTNMQLQKLVFIANGYSLAIKNRPLYWNNNHAWQWGPVIPRLYKSLQKYGSNEIPDVLESEDNIDKASWSHELIRATWEAYGKKSGAQLSALTHRPGTPWDRTWSTNRFDVIPLDLIRDHYRELLKKK